MNTQEIIELDQQFVANTYARLPVVFVKGQGARLWDADGREYVDFVGGLGVAGVGHANPAVAAAICVQAKTLLHVSNLFYTEPQASLAERLIDLSFPGKVFFANSGAEANEAAIKIARKYARDRGNESFTVVTARRSFHGRTLATLAATGQPEKHAAFAPMPEGFTYVPFNDVAALTEAVARGACAVMLEMIQGEGGVHVASLEYAQAARRLCQDNGILLIVDEVQTGLGRTGKMFAWQHYGIVPDVVTVAKSLGGGVPIGAAIIGAAAQDTLGPGDHGSTFGGSLLAAAAGLAVLDYIEANDLARRAEDMGAYLQEKLVETRDATGKIGEIRGRGLMLAAELTNPAAAAAVMGCLGKGVVINSTSPTTLRFLPPLTITTDEIDTLAAALTETLEEL
jgi:acetylornithine/N-succinyldiaminopimelate aminotransferase